MKKPKQMMTTKERERKAIRIYTAIILCVAMIFSFGVVAFAATEDDGGTEVLGAITNLSDFVFALIRAIGVILVGWGVVQVGLSFQSHDPSQRSNGFLTLAGGLVIMFAKSIMNLITGGN